MSRRRVLFYGCLLIVVVFSGLYLLSRTDSPGLIGVARDDLLLIGVVLAAVLAGLAALNDIWDLVLKLSGRQPEKGVRDTAQEKRNRQQLIQNVKATWIQGVRNQALYESVWIELGMTSEPDQVNRPWHMTWQTGHHQQPLEDNSIKRIFQEQSGNTLLILGEPGSGKTLTLLDLAQELLEETEEADDLGTPIPVVFNLSSWASKRRTLEEWLVDELKRTYSVPNKTAQRWLDEDTLILLLDGLDEVAQAQRKDCVEAINKYRQEHGLTGIAVCSRIQEYEALTQKLNLLGAVVIQPLTPEQADWYLKKMGKELMAVRKLLRKDEDLQKWVQSPLFLYVVAIAYRDLSMEDLRATHTGKLSHLYNTYVTQVLEQHRPYQKTDYTPQQTRRWLAYLASQLNERDLTIFYIEQLQPDWLGERLEGQADDGLLSKGLKRLLGRGDIEVTDRQWSWSEAWRGVKEDLFFVLFFVLVFVLFFVLFFVLVSVLGGGLGVGLGGGLGVGMGVVLVVWLLLAVYGGDVRKHEQPNQGIWRSLMNGLFFGLVFGLVFVLVVGLGGGLGVGLGGGLGVWLVFGLGVFIRHFTLRRLLADNDYLPFQLMPFLEYAKERLLLRRGGGGYIFIHRTLLEYFAAQDEEFNKISSD